MKLLMLLLIVGLAPNVLAQTSDNSSLLSKSIATPIRNGSALSPPEPVASSQQDDPLARQLEIVSNRLLTAEELNRLKDEQIKTLNERLAVKDERIAILTSQKGDIQGANSDRQAARTIDLERIADRDTIIAKQQAEIDRLRHPGLLASIFDTRSAYGFGAGFAACKLTNGGTTNPLQQFSNSKTYQLIAKGDETPLFLRFDQQAQQRKAFLKLFQKER